MGKKSASGAGRIPNNRTEAVPAATAKTEAVAPNPAPPGHGHGHPHIEFKFFEELKTIAPLTSKGLLHGFVDLSWLGIGASKDPRRTFDHGRVNHLPVDSEGPRGLGKIGAYAGIAAYMSSLGVPAAALLAIVIAAEVLGALAIIVGWQTRTTALLPAGFSLVTGLSSSTTTSATKST
jgi:hypothetical protein